MLSKKQKKIYIKKQGIRCPFCNSEDLEGNYHVDMDLEIRNKVQCLDCNKFWLDVYTLTDIEDTQEG